MYGMVSSHSGARARIKTKSFSPQASTEQPNYSSSKKAPKNFFQRIISFIKDAWYGITEPNGRNYFTQKELWIGLGLCADASTSGVRMPALRNPLHITVIQVDNPLGFHSHHATLPCNVNTPSGKTVR
ncbi:hypothetical protein TNCT_494171 [Trichonephila clavata]|uniref:Uncharacterized protein n=1 Tax=Trichonephila clavata TaxID=2740835 RepID=A0A8X6KW80_TRICU|nr:hypothetical protein TNCT_494171 [Trichonephila clavata]